MRVNTPKLETSSREELEVGYRTGKQHCFRVRCHIILLKSDGRPSKEVGNIVQLSHNSVNHWTKRYKVHGILGLKNISGQGRKPKISVAEDGESVKALVQEHRQRVSVAQQEWEEANNKTVNRATFRRFLKELAESTNVSASVAKDAKR